MEVRTTQPVFNYLANHYYIILFVLKDISNTETHNKCFEAATYYYSQLLKHIELEALPLARQNKTPPNAAIPLSIAVEQKYPLRLVN